LYITVFMWIHV